MLVLSVSAAAVLVAVIVWNAVLELPATAASTAIVAVVACFAVECVCGSVADLVHAAEWMSVENVAVECCNCCCESPCGVCVKVCCIC